MKLLVSVIVPVYNVELYVEQCIRSIMNQTYKNIEIIIVDDGSTDQSLKICRQLENIDSRIKTYHIKNCGAAAARNYGIKNSSGKYISFIDADDFIKNDFIEHLIKLIEKDDSDVAVCNYKVVEEDWKESNEVNLKDTENFTEEEIQYNGSYIIENRFGDNSIYFTIPCNKLFKKSLFNNALFNEGKRHEDEYILRPLFEQCDKVICSMKYLYLYRKRKGSAMDTALCDKNINDFLTCFNEEIEYYKNKGNLKLTKMYKKEFCYAYVLDYDYLSKKSKKYKNKQYRKYVITLFSINKQKKVNIKYFCCLLNIPFFKRIIEPIFYNNKRLQDE